MEIDIVDSLTNIRVFKGFLGYSKFVIKISRYQKFSKHENYLNFQLKFLTYTQRFTEIKTFSSVFLASDELPIPHQFVICIKLLNESNGYRIILADSSDGLKNLWTHELSEAVAKIWKLNLAHHRHDLSSRVGNIFY